MTDNFEKRCAEVNTIVNVISDIYLSNPILKHADKSTTYHLIYEEVLDRGYNYKLIDEAWFRWLDEYAG